MSDKPLTYNGVPIIKDPESPYPAYGVNEDKMVGSLADMQVEHGVTGWSGTNGIGKEVVGLMSETATQPGAEGALAAWFKSMKAGTAAKLREVAAAQPGVVDARVLTDPFDTAGVIVLVAIRGFEGDVLSIQQAIQDQAAAGARVQVIPVMHATR